MDFLTGSSFGLYVFIFFGKIIEVAVATVRMVLINRGERLQGSILALADILLWLLITGTVLTGFQEDIWKVVVFTVAFAVGNYIGSWLEGKLAFGLSSIQVIVPHEEDIQCLLESLWAHNFAVTVIEGEGRRGKRKILLIHLKRKRISNAVRLVQDKMENCVITVNDVKVIRGGYIKKS
mgnify:FL=1